MAAGRPKVDLVSVVLPALLIAVTVTRGTRAFTIPVRYDGFVLRPQRGDVVVLEKFIDPLCPDCKQSWPVVKQVIQRYGSELQFIGHPFANPFHHNAFLASRLLHAAQTVNSSLVYPLLDLIYLNQDAFSNDDTANESPASVVERLVALAGELGASVDKFRAAFADSATDQATRISFKYGCSRVVTSTPTFLVNGVLVDGADEKWSFEQWVKLLDPLVYGPAAAAVDTRARGFAHPTA